MSCKPTVGKVQYFCHKIKMPRYQKHSTRHARHLPFNYFEWLTLNVTRVLGLTPDYVIYVKCDHFNT